MTGIFPPERKAVPQHSELVSIIDGAVSKPATMTITDSKPPYVDDNDSKSDEPITKNVDEQTLSVLVRVARQRRIPPNTQCSVLVVSRQDGLVILKPHPHVAKRNLLLVAMGIMDVKRHHPFHIWISNFSVKSMLVPKGVLVANRTETPCEVYALRKSPVNDYVTVNPTLPVEYRSTDDKATQMAKHVEVAAADESKLSEDWTEQVEISPKYEGYRPQVINVNYAAIS